jgi:hypothetical protein
VNLCFASQKKLTMLPSTNWHWPTGAPCNDPDFNLPNWLKCWMCRV